MSGAIRFILLGALAILASIGVDLRGAGESIASLSILGAAAVPTSARCCQGRQRRGAHPGHSTGGRCGPASSADRGIRCPTSSS